MTETHGFAHAGYGPVADTSAASFTDGTEVGATRAIAAGGPVSSTCMPI
jgi:hypothetical protein